MDYVYEVLSKPSADRSDEDIGKYSMWYAAIWFVQLCSWNRSCNGCPSVHASKCVCMLMYVDVCACLCKCMWMCVHACLQCSNIWHNLLFQAFSNMTANTRRSLFQVLMLNHYDNENSVVVDNGDRVSVLLLSITLLLSMYLIQIFFFFTSLFYIFLFFFLLLLLGWQVVCSSQWPTSFATWLRTREGVSHRRSVSCSCDKFCHCICV